MSQDLSESEQDLESSLMMLQNSVQEWLECKPLPITLQSRVRVERVRMGMNMEISPQPSPKLGESRKEVYFTQPDLVGIGRASNVNIVIDIFFESLWIQVARLTCKTQPHPPPQLPCFFHPQYGRHSN